MSACEKCSGQCATGPDLLCDFCRNAKSELATAPADRTPFLRDVTTNWEKTKGDNEITCHSRMIGGVLCRWWGDGDAPSGVKMIDTAFPPDESSPAGSAFRADKNWQAAMTAKPSALG